MINRECYELTLTQNYVSDWDFNDAIRELIQNGTDQEIIEPDNKFSLEYDEENKILKFINKTSKLKVNTLLLGRSSKSDNEDTVGQFGEGYKIAALVLNRLGKNFTIHNNERNEVWTTKFKNSEKWKEKILAFYIEKQATEDTGLVIEVGNVERREYANIDYIWLNPDYDLDKISTSYGEIILEEGYINQIYANGLKVGCNSKLEYGYNFKSKYVKLERDRKTCDSWNVENLTSKMIMESVVNGDLPFEKVEKLIEENTDDIYHLQFNTGNAGAEELKEKLIETFDKNNKEILSIPVSTQEQIKKVKAYGGNPVIVPYQVANLLKSETEKRITQLISMPTEEELPLKERFKRWFDIYAGKLDTTARQELEGLIEEMF